MKWKPQYPVPAQGGGQPGASWDPDGHWDVDDGQGNRGRYDPDGNPVEHDARNLSPFGAWPPTSSNQVPPVVWPLWLIPLIPFPGNPLYGGL